MKRIKKEQEISKHLPDVQRENNKRKGNRRQANVAIVFPRAFSSSRVHGYISYENILTLNFFKELVFTGQNILRTDT